ncbi:MAG: indole-3-glycerol phosphate synthase TrpC [Kiritimatiellae bacterium]|nr:indole-3-glycerol phosphate synthase TrpC [Kiritimatiellia bacterium]
MHDFLKKIIAARRRDIAEAEKQIPLAVLRKAAKAKQPPRSLMARLQTAPQGRPANIIAEMKRASPSEGEIATNLNPAALAREYEAAGAAAISVLTEPHYFRGKDSDLREARRAVKIPVLRKDFTVAPWQVYQSAVLGADVILLIAAALPPASLKELYRASEEAGLEAIIEVHSLPELETALRFPRAIIGVNNRNLATLKTDIAAAVKLADSIPESRVAIAESGIRSRREITLLAELDYRGFLVGTSLLKSKSPGAAVKKLAGI